MSRIKLMNRRYVAPAIAALYSVISAVMVLAQTSDPVDQTVSRTTTSTTVWYSEWWVWAAAVAVFLIVIVALTNRGGSRA